ncbi:MAG: hypothetical protein HY896_13230 [Deltaproteobacteria bacterium]|nr:hypothetical protein [Deltaproteobacteria bacterium]
MNTAACRKICSALLVMLVSAFFVSLAAASELRRNISHSQKPAGKIRLQIRISEAKKKKSSVRYYRSVARQQKTVKAGGRGIPNM